MMDHQNFSTSGIWTLLLASAALMGSPGPSTISATAVGAAFGLRRSARYVLGLVLGTILVLLVVATGIFTVMMSVPSLVPILTAMSTAYIVILAIRIARAPPLKQQNAAADVPSFFEGTFLAATNPKAYVAIGAIFAGSRLDGFPPWMEALLKAALLSSMVVLIHLAWLLVGTSFSRLLRDPLTSRIINVSLALVLVITTLLAVLPR
ncbi:LysE family translocator [Roseomonas nepalensis]|uniref:LysE family translocator n=1 Tax=Muricoccus nepalensis TaxID=1854500 RepID=A0A502G717_9PROT|nr:LysE family transporter [Roseomonas nepalensis]TPG57381.1 LysE family translocator [Roseomonas nepalensis]